MNAGLLLKKPGESKYSIMRRFLIANYGLKLDFSSSSKSKNSIYPLLSKIARIENKYIRQHKLPFRTNGAKLFKEIIERPGKSCPKCMALGFHSDAFKLDWLNTCPVHNVELTSFCPECDSLWNQYSALKLNHKCPVCGLNMKLNKIDIKDFDSSIFGVFTKTLEKWSLKREATFHHLARNQTLKHERNLLFHLLWEHNLTNQSVLIFSLLKTKGKLKLNDSSLLTKYNIPIIDVHKLKIDISQSGRCSDVFDSQKLDAIGIKHLNLISSFLSLDLDDEQNIKQHIYNEGISQSISPYFITALLLNKHFITSIVSSKLSHSSFQILNRLHSWHLTDNSHILGGSSRFGRWSFFKQIWSVLPNIELINLICHAEVWNLSYNSILITQSYIQKHKINDGIIDWGELFRIIRRLTFRLRSNHFTFDAEIFKSNLEIKIPMHFLNNSFVLGAQESRFWELTYKDYYWGIFD
ncbi:hypothetical protein ACFODZ_02980 [Marinicella sediminis]|uniref:TniQ family protein n=1 Tax=Marinicella sediminis TaxID=1792834 RepID=A0ABV7J8E0_9GAMM|nr:hypothetical protein [Marinicella sediminis]